MSLCVGVVCDDLAALNNAWEGRGDHDSAVNSRQSVGRAGWQDGLALLPPLAPLAGRPPHHRRRSCGKIHCWALCRRFIA